MQTDWQTTHISLDGLHLQADCNSGASRVVKHATCACGQSVLIEVNAKHSNRRDRKRVFYADSPDNLSAFRCRGCHEPVSECVPGAEYDEQPNARIEPARSRRT